MSEVLPVQTVIEDLGLPIGAIHINVQGNLVITNVPTNNDGTIRGNRRYSCGACARNILFVIVLLALAAAAVYLGLILSGKVKIGV